MEMTPVSCPCCLTQGEDNEATLNDNIIEQKVTQTVSRKARNIFNHLVTKTNHLTAQAPLAMGGEWGVGIQGTKGQDGSNTIDGSASVKVENDNKTVNGSLNGSASFHQDPKGNITTGGSVGIQITGKF